MRWKIVACSIAILLATSAAAFVRPETTRAYLQGPKSELMAVMWREGMITLGEVVHEDNWREMPYWAQTAGGIRLLVGADRRLPSWKSVRWLTEDPERPLDGLIFRDGDVEFRFEAVVPFGRREAVRGRLVCSNVGKKDSRLDFAFMMRSGKERDLVFGSPDIYEFYNPDRSLESWKSLPSTWVKCADGLCRDGARFVRFGGGMKGAWDVTNRVQRYEATLKPGEEKSVEFAFGIGHAIASDFDEARQRQRVDWQGEMRRAARHSPLMKRLIVQMLQCFSCPTEGDFVLPRQGGLQRYVWPGETAVVTEALLRLGYPEYAKAACDFMLRLAKDDGSIGPFANGWASDTANVLLILARYCRLTRDVDYWTAHRRTVAKASDWIESMRVKKGAEGLVPGLFPPLKSTDSTLVFQNWALTDVVNEKALRETAEAAEAFGDRELANVCRARAGDYRGVIALVMDRWRTENDGKDVFKIPFSPDGRLEKELRNAKFFFLHPGEFAAAGYLRDDELDRCRNWLVSEGVACEEGLYMRHPSGRPEFGRHIWYTTWSEYRWFLAWTKAGRADRAKKALDALLKYSVTEEGIVGERIHDANPWYWPWSPNTSDAARLVLMLL